MARILVQPLWLKGHKFRVAFAVARLLTNEYCSAQLSPAEVTLFLESPSQSSRALYDIDCDYITLIDHQRPRSLVTMDDPASRVPGQLVLSCPSFPIMASIETPLTSTLQNISCPICILFRAIAIL